MNPDINLQNEITKSRILESRDYYAGKSMNYAFQWHSGITYRNDNFVMDFVSYENVLYACRTTHLSGYNNCPSNDSKVWDVVLHINSVQTRSSDVFTIYINSVDTKVSINDINHLIVNVKKNKDYNIYYNEDNGSSFISYKIEKVELLNGVIKLYFNNQKLVLICDIESGEIVKIFN